MAMDAETSTHGRPRLPAQPPRRSGRREPGALGTLALIFIVAIIGWISAASQLLPTTTATSIPRRGVAANLPAPTATSGASFPSVAESSTAQADAPNPPPAVPTALTAGAFSLPPPAPSPAVNSTTAPAGATPNALAGSASGTVHTVVSGDTLFGIARQYQVSPDALAAANGFPDPSSLRVGQQLVIPGLAAVSGTVAPTATPRP